MNISNIIKNSNEIYNYFTDQKSKMIFEQRLLYSITNDDNKILDMINNLFLEKIDYSLFCSANRENSSLSVYDTSKPLVLYGVGVVGMYYYKMFKLHNQKHITFCDRRANQIQSFQGVPVISPETLTTELKNKVNIAILAPVHLEEIKQFLLNSGVSSDNIYYLNFPLDANESYFDPVIKFNNNEIFVDGGSLDGATSLLFANAVENSFKKIYLFEPDKNSYEVLNENIKKLDENKIALYNKGLWSSEKELSFNSWGNGGSHVNNNGVEKILVDSLDNIIKDEDVTFIKMDIEGSEMEALKGAENVIKRCKPKLAICVYHKPDDIVDIPAYIKSLVPEYKFYLRHYSFSASETVLYAVL